MVIEYRKGYGNVLGKVKYVMTNRSCLNKAYERLKRGIEFKLIRKICFNSF